VGQATQPIVLYKTADTESDGEIKGDEIFTEFQSILKKAGVEKILEADGGGQIIFETVGQHPTRFQLVVADDEIKFSEASVGKNYYSSESAHGIIFGKNERGAFQYTGSFEISNNEISGKIKVSETEKISETQYDRVVGLADVQNWKYLEDNLVAGEIHLEDELAAQIKLVNQSNLEKYLSRQLGRELIAEIGTRDAEYKATKFRNNLNNEVLPVKVVIGEKEETREISYAVLHRERQAIARSDVSNDEKSGILQMIAEDEGISLEEAGKRQYAKAIATAEELQKPWIDAFSEAVSKQTMRLKENTKDAEFMLKTEKAETAAVKAQTGIEDIRTIQPTLPPEIVWLEQIKAVKRGDTETFTQLEEINQVAGLPRPNDVYARLRGMETLVTVTAVEERKKLTEWLGEQKAGAGAEKIVVNLRHEYGELKVENWRVRQVEEKHASLTAEAAANHQQAEQERKTANRDALRPLMNKINPFSTVQGNLSWLTNPISTLNARFNPIEIVKNDPGVQIIRAVAGYIEHTYKAEQFKKMADAALKEAQFLHEEFASGVADNAAKLAESVKAAVKSEEALRDNLRQDSSLNADLLTTPEAGLTDEEMQKIGRTAMKTGDPRETKAYHELVKNDGAFAEAIGETEETLGAAGLLAELRTAGKANVAIENIVPLRDGSIDVELNPARLANAMESIKTAETIGEIQAEFQLNAGKSVIQKLSLEETAFAEELVAGINQLERGVTVEQMSAGINQLADSLTTQITNIGNDLTKNLHTQLLPAEQQIAEEMKFSPMVQNRFVQIQQSESQLDVMAQQAEIATQNGVPFQQTAQNFEVTNPNVKIEAKEMEFWEKDRTLRESQIAREKLQLSKTQIAEEAEIAKAAEIDAIESAAAEAEAASVGTKIVASMV
jgi:hypothetical protein